MRITKLIPIFLLGFSNLYAQPINKFTKEFAISTPEASALGKYADLPLNYSNGTASIDIPIYSITDGPIKLDVSTSYHTGGIRLSEMASWVGLGWSLNAGGMITRSVLGIPDDYYSYGKGYYYSASTLKDPFLEYTSDPPVPGQYNNVQSQVNAASDGAMDSEPDAFSFNFNGYSGKFVFDKYKTVNFLESSDIKIVPFFINYEFVGFNVKTPDGTQYTFGSTTYLNNSYIGVERTLIPLSNPVKEYNTTWYLNKIESGDGKFSLTFEYQYDGELMYLSNPTQQVFPFISCITCTCGGCVGQGCASFPTTQYNYTDYKPENQYRAWRIKRIYSKTDTIRFNSTTNREDLPNADRLDEIVVKTSNSSYCAKYTFTYTYMVSPGSAVDNRKKRLILQSIQERACDNSIINNPYIFSYVSSVLPERLDLGRDHWGYYNGATTNNAQNFDGIPANPVPNYQGTFPAIPWANGNRNSSESHMLIGTLNKVEYPLGGRTELMLEANTYSKYNCITYQTCSTLFELHSCTQPWQGGGSGCCGITMVQGTYTHTSTQTDLSFHLTGYKAPACAWNNFASFIGVKIFNSNNVQVGNFSITVPPPTGNSAYVEKLLSSVFTPILNATYTIKLETHESAKGDLIICDPSNYTSCDTINTIVGGLRVKQIKTYSSLSDADPIIKNYNYNGSTNKSHGVLNKEPNYGGNMYQYNFGQNSTTLLGVKLFSDSYAPLTSYNGNIVTYSSVCELIPNNGKTVYRYNIEFTPPTPCCYSSNHIPLAPDPVEILDAVLIKKLVINQNNDTLRSETLTYSSPGYSNIAGNVYKVLGIPVGISCSYNSVKTYNNRKGFKRIQIKTIKQDGVVTIENITYDAQNRFQMPATISMNNSDGIITLTTNTYNFDYPSTLIRADLLARNIIQEPYKTSVKVGNDIVDGTETEYAWFNLSTGVKTTGPTNSFPRTYIRFRHEKTWTGITLTGPGKTAQDTIRQYNAYGLPYKYGVTNWKTITLDWSSVGLLTKKTFEGQFEQYDYFPGTKLISTITGIDGQQTLFEYDPLSRLKKTRQRQNNVVTDYNYHQQITGDLYNWIYKKTTYTPVSGSSLNIVEEKNYFDGLGREIENVKYRYANGSNDLITSKEYDNVGRMSKQYLPFISSGTGGAFNSVPGGTKYHLTQYEPSPLGRISRETPPDWYATKFYYGTNATNEVKRTHPVSSPTYYAANSLVREVTQDTANLQTITFRDKKGRTVLVRQSKVGAPSSDYVDTYTLFDGKDRANKVVPPGATDGTPNLLYSYTYDPSDNMLTKIIPDQGLTTMVYDNRDLLTYMRDPNLTAQSKWNVSKYDNWGRVIKTGFWTSASAPPNGETGGMTITDSLTSVSYGASGINTGKIIQSRSKIISNYAANSWLFAVNTYDAYGRVRTVAGNNHLYINNGSSQRHNFGYDFADNILTDTLFHQPSSGSTQTVISRNTYDAFGRAIAAYHKINANPEKQLSQLTYNFKGELIEKNVGKTTPTWLQSIDYTYNSQGWLTQINTPFINPTGISDFENFDAYRQIISYDAAPQSVTGITPVINKSNNITQMVWQNRGQTTSQGYNFEYDYLNRVVKANYFDVTGGTGTLNNNYREYESYDLRGNILTMNRHGLISPTWVRAKIDSLVYTYTTGTNKLSKINDLAANANGFNMNGATTSEVYTYDNNGNIKTDPYKKISNTTFNYLNLPDIISVTGAPNKEIRFTYDASGIKLRKAITLVGGAPSGLKQDYAEGIEYANDVIEAIYHPEGRVVWIPATSTWRYEYNVTDHLGNVRAVVSDVDNDGSLYNDFTTEITQQSSYYPFGLKMAGPFQNNGSIPDTRYQYNDKEFNDDLGLNLYDYGARWYDPAVGRWTSVDPMTDISPSLTPFRYGFNNPIIFTDPNGMYESSNATYEAMKAEMNKSDKNQKKKEENQQFVENVNQILSSMNNTIISSATDTLPKAMSNYIAGLAPPITNWGFTDVSDPIKYPNIKIYQHPLMSGAIALPGFGIVTEPMSLGLRRTIYEQHEYGHIMDYRYSGDIHSGLHFYLKIGLPSLFSATFTSSQKHNVFWTELRANRWAMAYFGTDIAPNFNTYNPITKPSIKP